jgi:hypothetical protein
MTDDSFTKIAQRGSWKTVPPGPMTPIPYVSSFSQAQYETMRQGFVPVEMEDKWFVFWEADSLFFHRSWTGYCVYRVDFQPAADGFQVAWAAVSADVKQYRRDSDQREAEIVDFLIRRLLLHEAVEFPLRERLSSGTEQIPFLLRVRRWLRL